jgi:hypothetical protein
MRKGFFILGVMLFSGVVNAALPPLYQTGAELHSVLNLDELGKYLPDGEPILEIRKNEQGYVIITNKHTLQAEVVYQPATRPGPARFQIKFHEPIPLN